MDAGRPIPIDDAVWRPWDPEAVAARLADVRADGGRPVRWAVAGGWAIDCFLGRITRVHEDLEIVVLEDDVAAVLVAFDAPEWTWLVPLEDGLHPLGSAALERSHQTWLRSRTDDAFVLDVFRNAHDGDTWICRRDPAITEPWSEVVGSTPTGVPYLAPQVVLLFKAKYARAKDVADLEQALPAMDEAQRGWLRGTLSRVHPGHDWLRRLETTASRLP